MNQYQQSPGRFLEVIVGLITLAISLIFFGLLTILVKNSSFSYSALLGGAALVLCTYWFGAISIRLLLNRPQKNGGLFSIGGLKFWCIFLGVTSVATVLLATYLGHFGAAIGSIGLSIACYKGWKMALARENT